MNTYIIRVVLHDADPEKYEKLHEAMYAKGAVREISDHVGTYHLPDAEYFLKTEKDAQDVLFDVINVAETIQNNSSALVSKADIITWRLPMKK